MAARKKTTKPQLAGAEEFAGPDAEQEAIEKIAAARIAADKEKAADNGDNGGPLLDEDAWRRAVNEYSAEMLAMEDLESQKAEVAGRISSIRKVAKKLKVDWDLVKRYYEEHKAIRKGGMGAMVTDERRYRRLLQLMGSPLGTQFTLWGVEAEQQPGEASAKPGMDAELQGQHAYRNNEPRENNPFQPGTQDHVDWGLGWNNAQTATARQMGPNGGGSAEAH
jgi:hypothetical protein